MATIRSSAGNLTRGTYILRRAFREEVLRTLSDSYSADDWQAAREHFDGRCAYCGAVSPTRRDRVVAVAKWGAFVRTNVVPACATCDDSKGDRDFRAWLRGNARLSPRRRQGLAEQQIEAAIVKVERWIEAYSPGEGADILGPDYERYQKLDREIKVLGAEAKLLVHRLQAARVTSASIKPASASRQNVAVRARELVDTQYIRPARANGSTRIQIAARDLHLEMGLTNAYAAVCQALRGTKLQSQADITLLTYTEPCPSSTTVFSYSI